VSDWRAALRHAIVILLLAAPLGLGVGIGLYVVLPPDSLGVLAALPLCGLGLLALPLVRLLRNR
jgi:hypothetical protein